MCKGAVGFQAALLLSGLSEFSTWFSGVLCVRERGRHNSQSQEANLFFRVALGLEFAVSALPIVSGKSEK